MQVTTKNIVIIWSIIVASGCFGYWIGAMTNKSELEKVIEWNTRHIQSIGVLSVTESRNAELLIQIQNALNDRPVKDVARQYDLPKFDPVEQDAELPVTMEQVLRDQREIDTSIRSFSVQNLFQADALHSVLDKIKDKN
tara:strand:+ start:548 stop:964 length:417 start_codon:yes stop_codon:yes gene_type:complete